MCVHIDPFEPKEAPDCAGCVAPPEPKKKRKAPSPPPTLEDLADSQPNPFDVHIAEIEAGKRCLECMTLRDHKNRCLCDREQQFLAETSEIEEWFATVDRDLCPMAGNMAAGNLRRAHLLLGRDTPSKYAGVSLMQLDTEASRPRYLGERKMGRWRKPTVTDPQELPI